MLLVTMTYHLDASSSEEDPEVGSPPYEILDVNEVIQGLLNDTDSELSELEHLDAPNEGVYMMCGVLIAMVFVGLIIVLLADVTITALPTERPGFCRGMRKNLGGRWKRLVKRKTVPDSCAVSRDHLKQIYVY
ncbi:hypothetical protein B566_EDAN001044 [Ephemera danica]|nr:hypothetical protein B566_EDAN001044 [Ephemera danica]